MEAFVRRFIRSSLIWLGAGVLIGLSMAIWPAEAIIYRPAHAHANLLGFVSMMIFGVAYHVVPRFSGNPLRSRRAAGVHLWVANAGLAMLVGGWILRVHLPAVAGYVIGFGGLTSAAGAFLFIVNVWRTLEPHVSRAPGAPARSATGGGVRNTVRATG